MPKKLIKTESDDNDEEWHDGLFGCFSNCEILFMGWCCPCIRWGKTLDKAKLWDFHHAAGLMAILVLTPAIVAQLIRNANAGVRDPGSPGEIAISAVTTICEAIMFVMIYTFRRKMIKKYKIDEGECCSCLSIFFCVGCAICQEARHVEEAED